MTEPLVKRISLDRTFADAVNSGLYWISHAGSEHPRKCLLFVVCKADDFAIGIRDRFPNCDDGGKKCFAGLLWLLLQPN